MRKSSDEQTTTLDTIYYIHQILVHCAEESFFTVAIMSFPSEEAIKAFPKLVSPNMGLTMDMEKFALYTLVPLSDPATFLRLVNENDVLEDYVVFAPDHDFSDRTLADVVAYHRELTQGTHNDKSIDNANFIVAVHDDVVKHGVLVIDMVYEFYDNITAVPALARCPVYAGAGDENDIDAVSWCVNLQIGNMSMFLLKRSVQQS